MTERDALLRGIAANPSDDVARLVFADWLDEHGEPARAEFIRAQIEAENLHRNSPRRRALEKRAEELFSENWFYWLAEIATKVGLPEVTLPKPRGWWQRILGSAEKSPGWPYLKRGRWGVAKDVYFPGPQFQRGFPDCIRIYAWETDNGIVITSGDLLLNSWIDLFPLTTLSLMQVESLFVLMRSSQESLISPLAECPFETVTQLLVGSGSPTALVALFSAWNYSALQNLTFRSLGPEEGLREVRTLANSRLAPQIRNFTLDVGEVTPDLIDAVAEAEKLANLEELVISRESGVGETREWEFAPRVAGLARAPHLAGLRSLDLPSSHLSAVEGLVHNPVWKGLRRLALRHPLPLESARVLASPTGVPDLEDLTIELAGGPRLVEICQTLSEGTLWPRLRHLEIGYGPCGWPLGNTIVTAIIQNLDPDRLETLRIWGDTLPRRTRKLLEARFPDRVLVD